MPFVAFVREVSAANTGPMVVHCRLAGEREEREGAKGPIKCILSSCSAGVGRTGVFCTIMTQMKRITDVGSVDIFNYVKSMRSKRNFMVQTEVRERQGILYKKREGIHIC